MLLSSEQRVREETTRHNHVQTCRCLSLAAPVRSLIATVLIMGAPTTSTTKLADPLMVWLPYKTRRKTFLYFYFIQCDADQVFDRSRAKSATSKSPRLNTTELMASIKVTNYSIHLGWMLARYDFQSQNRIYWKKSKIKIFQTVRFGVECPKYYI